MRKNKIQLTKRRKKHSKVKCKANLKAIEIEMQSINIEEPIVEAKALEDYTDKDDQLKQKVDELLLKPFIKENKPDKIIGVFDAAGTLLFLVKYKNAEANFVPASVANKHWPAMVIKFYESNIEWNEPGTATQTL